ncbi:MAG TPA: NlpC/P60 family protein [Jatrophihabitans sp.]|nr:NlpC/P60 family protein [Jatrophihabitans sp.]
MRTLARRFGLPVKLALTGLIALLTLTTVSFTSTATAATPTLGQRAVAVARAQVGKPYRYGAAGPNAFDCSGLTEYAYARVGRRLPHNALAQYLVTRHVSLSQLRPGDLVFMNFSGGSPRGISHVGIYAGRGNWYVARTPGTRITLQHIWTHRGVYASRP